MPTVDNNVAEVTPEVIIDPKADWEWVEVPDEDFFGEEHNGVSINFEKYGPGRHFVSPKIALTIRNLVKADQRAQLRILQPQGDKKMAEIMNRNGKRAAQSHNG